MENYLHEQMFNTLYRWISYVYKNYLVNLKSIT